MSIAKNKNIQILDNNSKSPLSNLKNDSMYSKHKKNNNAYTDQQFEQ